MGGEHVDPSVYHKKGGLVLVVVHVNDILCVGPWGALEELYASFRKLHCFEERDVPKRYRRLNQARRRTEEGPIVDQTRNRWIIFRSRWSAEVWHFSRAHNEGRNGESARWEGVGPSPQRKSLHRNLDLHVAGRPTRILAQRMSRPTLWVEVGIKPVAR